jgi:hypothetical protein
VAPKAKAPAKASKATVATAKPKGLQLSAAQWKAYNAAYSAYATAAYKALAAQQRAAALQAAALGLQKGRLNAAHALMKKAAAAHSIARTTAIAAFAAKTSFRQSQLAHQNAALQQRVFADYERHLRAAGRAQFVYKGEKAYAHTAIMHTLTTAQATSVMQAKFAQAAKTAKAAVRSTNVKGATPSPQVAAIQAAAKAAGLAAAQSVPASQQFAAVRSAARAKARATAHATASKTAKATAAATRAAKKKGVTPAPKTARTAPRPGLPGMTGGTGRWRGNPDGYDCVAAAIANSCLLGNGHSLTAEEYAVLCAALGPAPDLGHALLVAWRLGQARVMPYLMRCPEKTDPALPASGDVIGFETENGPHAALYLGAGLIASWGEVLRLESVMLPGTGIEESWELTWERV